ncbi:Dynamin-1-like protein, partial [Perkinsus olseni]
MGKLFVGYAVLDFDTKGPVKFGLIDVRDFTDVHQRADQVTSALRAVKEEREAEVRSMEALSVALSVVCQFAADHPEATAATAAVQWHIGYQEHLHGFPHKRGATQRKYLDGLKLHGIVQHDLHRVFNQPGVEPPRVKIFPVASRVARRFMGVDNVGQPSRLELHKMAVEEIPDFPSLYHQNGQLNECVYYISDAWAVAAYTKQLVQAARFQADTAAFDRMKASVMKNNKHIKELIEARDAAKTRRIARDLDDVINSRVEKLATDMWMKSRRKAERAAERSEELIPVINRLQDLLSTVGLHVTLDLPQLAVVGCQSVGKTSVLEALVGRDFLPRGTGIVTRRPLILQLRNTTKDQVVGPTIKAGSSGGGGGDKTAKEWGEFSHCPNKKFSDFAEIRREIQEDTERLCGASKGVSPEPICLKIFSPYVIDLTLIDLPGITKVPVGDQPLDVEARIKDMVLSYISKPNCIILAVTAANTDLANSDSLQLARQVDPSGDRTMGVITKMDCMDEGTDALDMINGKVYPLRQGYVGVVCRSQKDIQNGVTIRESIKNEEAFFKKHEAYRHIAAHCGTAYMARQLHRILMTHIREALPGLRDRVNAMLHEHEQEMSDYGNDLSGGMLDHTQAGNVLLQLFTKFSRCFADCIEGRNNSNRHDIIDGAPLPAIVGGARIHYIFFDVFGAAVNQFDPFDGLTDHDIRTSIRNANGPKSPLFVPEAAFETLVKGQINKLLSPSLQCAELVHAELTKCLSVTIRSIPEFRRFDKLRARVYDVVRSVLASCLAPTKEMIRNLIRIETGYINTNHPDFIGGSRAISACSMAYSSESPRYALDATAAAGFHFSKGDPPMSAMDPPPSL